MRSLAYFIREALSNSKKNFSTTLGAIVTIFLSLFIVGVFMALSILIYQLMDEIKGNLSIEIFINDAAVEADVGTFEDFLRGLPEVKEVTYVSKEEALEQFKEQSSIAGIADALDGNPLPAKFVIILSDPEQTPQVVPRIMENESFLRVIDMPESPDESIKYGAEVINPMISIFNFVRLVCLVFVSLQIFVALIFINITIRLSILARRKEIAIMRLVGASNGFIRGPFLMEGALQALIGVGLATGSISLICNFLSTKVQEFGLQWLPISFLMSNLWMIHLVLLGAGLLIGLFGSVWAMRRYLKV
jgi:cell division transport system permease protein